MCVVSMIMDHYRDRWLPYVYPTTLPNTPGNIPYTPQAPFTIQLAPEITPEEIEEFRRLLARAREYDRRNNEPDCEMEEKKQLLRDLAKRLGIDISFIDEQ